MQPFAGRIYSEAQRLITLVEDIINRSHLDAGIVSAAEDNKTAVFTVKDTGIGIPQEHLDRIFERFYRVDKSHSKEVGGTGLGLSIVKHAALIHNAKITVESTV